jgi:hypothetical protein
MAFETKLSEQHTNQVVALLDQAVRAGGIQTARIALPIVDSLSEQVTKYNESLVPKTDCVKDPVGQ